MTHNVALICGHETFLMCVPEVAAVRDGNFLAGKPWAVCIILGQVKHRVNHRLFD
jgi:hypothetical protein